MTELTQQDQDVVRRAAFGAMALVSQADPGFFAMFKKSMAGSRALASAPDNIRQLLQGGMIMPERACSREEMQQNVLNDLQNAMQMLQGDPQAQAGTSPASTLET